MKTIKIELTEEEYECLKDRAECLSRWMLKNDLFLQVEEKKNWKVTPKRIIEQFVSDLTCSERSGGSDERDLANEWFDRSRFNFY